MKICQAEIVEGQDMMAVLCKNAQLGESMLADMIWNGGKSSLSRVINYLQLYDYPDHRILLQPPLRMQESNKIGASIRIRQRRVISLNENRGEERREAPPPLFGEAGKMR